MTTKRAQNARIIKFSNFEGMVAAQSWKATENTQSAFFFFVAQNSTKRTRNSDVFKLYHFQSVVMLPQIFFVSSKQLPSPVLFVKTVATAFVVYIVCTNAFLWLCYKISNINNVIVRPATVRNFIKMVVCKVYNKGAKILPWRRLRLSCFR